MQCYLNCVHISEVPKFLAETPNETTHAIELVDPFDATHLLIIPLQLSGVISYFDVFSPSITDYEDEGIPKIHLTAEEPYWNLRKRKTNAQSSKSDNDNLASALEAQIQISIALIGTIRKLSIDPIVLAKRWGITLKKA